MRSRRPEVLEEMLEVAARLFGTHRFHEVRIDDIADEVGVGKGTVYRHFKDKEELYLALLKRSAVQINTRLREALAPVAGGVARLEVVVETIITFFDEQPHLFDLIQRAEVLRRQDFPWQQTREDVLKLVTDLFVEARVRGEFVVADPELGTLMLLGGLRGLIRFGKKPRPPGLARQVVAAFLYGAAHQPESSVGPQRRSGIVHESIR